MRKHSKLITVGLAAFAVTAIACGSGAADGDDTAAPASSSTAESAATTAAAAKPTKAAKPAGPATSFGDGTYEVGKDIAAGTYSATADPDGFGCYWEREKALDGDFNSIIANANGTPGAKMKVTIKKTDKGFKTAGCGTWKRA